MPTEEQAPAEQQEKEPTAGTTEAQPDKATGSTFTQEQVNKFTGNAREEGRKAAEKALLEKAGVKSLDDLAAVVEAHHKAEADKLSDTEKANKRIAELEKERDTLTAENAGLKLQREFDGSVKKLNLKFVNEKASDDAYSLLDAETVKEKGMEAAVKLLHEERSYLFGTVEVPELDATKKNKNNPGVLTDDKKEELRRRIPSLRR